MLANALMQLNAIARKSPIKCDVKFMLITQALKVSQCKFYQLGCFYLTTVGCKSSIKCDSRHSLDPLALSPFSSPEDEACPLPPAVPGPPA